MRSVCEIHTTKLWSFLAALPPIKQYHIQNTSYKCPRRSADR